MGGGLSAWRLLLATAKEAEDVEDAEAVGCEPLGKA